jgi:hypothetical protein
MAGGSASETGSTIAGSVQRAIVSMVRLSSAFALFGIEKVQTAVSFQSGASLPGAVKDLGSVFDAMTESLAGQMDPGKREMLDSAARIAEQVAQQSEEGLRMMDPRRVVQAANELVQRSAETIANWSGNAHPSGGANGDDKPRLAVDVLTAQEQPDR